jgi:hypothetical protein
MLRLRRPSISTSTRLIIGLTGALFLPQPPQELKSYASNLAELTQIAHGEIIEPGIEIFTGSPDRPQYVRALIHGLCRVSGHWLLFALPFYFVSFLFFSTRTATRPTFLVDWVTVVGAAFGLLLPLALLHPIAPDLGERYGGNLFAVVAFAAWVALNAWMGRTVGRKADNGLAGFRESSGAVESPVEPKESQ